MTLRFMTQTLRWIVPVLILGSSAEAVSFYSNRLFVGPGLPLGTDLRQAGLLGPQANFPSGKQLLLLRSLNLPLQSGSNQGLTSGLALYTKVLKPYKANTTLVFTAGGNLADRQSAGSKLPSKLSEIQNLAPLQGSWSIWLDREGSLAKIAAPKAELGDRESWGGVNLLACLQDGKVTSVYQDYLLDVAASGRLNAIAERCTETGVRPTQLALPFRGGGVPSYTLRDLEGNTLEGGKIKGPYALIALAPDKVFPGLDPTQVYNDAARFLKAANIPLYVVALPIGSPAGDYQDTATVAASLRKSLKVPVYTDAVGTFIDRFSNYLGQASMILLFGKQGQLLDSFASNAGDFVLPNTLPQALVEYDLF